MRIESIATYRGCEIHAYQDEQRIRSVVMVEIDKVFEMEDPAALFQFAGSAAHAPEARLLASRRLLEWADDAEQGRRRMPFSRVEIEAQAAGLDDFGWHDPGAYCSLCDQTPERAARRPEPFRSELAALADR
ncbi:hypothetical protein WOC76_12475 [Methylocystis sp. IM3]|uniref:hypothetical protein n=1 Tax=unclassified Methylocystis TaxID=2625913 RepID=UPI0030F5A51A